MDHYSQTGVVPRVLVPPEKQDIVVLDFKRSNHNSPPNRIDFSSFLRQLNLSWFTYQVPSVGVYASCLRIFKKLEF